MLNPTPYQCRVSMEEERRQVAMEHCMEKVIPRLAAKMTGPVRKDAGNTEMLSLLPG